MNEQWHRYFRRYARECFPRFAFGQPWNYKDDICVLGCLMLHRATGEAVYRDAILACAPALTNESGALVCWQEAEHNLDTVSFGKSLLALDALTGNRAYRDAALRIWRHLDAHPRVSTGNFWHKDIYPHQVWLDGLYMALPFCAACMELTGSAAYDDVLAQFAGVRRHLWAEEKKLYIHAWDESRQSEWADPATGQSPSFWLRAEGWYLMALVDCYEILSRRTDAAMLARLLAEAVEGLMPYRHGASGMFLQLIDRNDLPGNYPETSGSAMVAYALMKGARLGMLKHHAARQGADILESIRARYLSREGEELVLRGICASAGLGPGPDNRSDRDGSSAYYLSEAQRPDNQHGSAACMMAFAELLMSESSPL